MQLKNGVKISGIDTELLMVIFIADGIYTRNKQIMTITSILDGKHSTNSLHYEGRAFDIRTHDKSEAVNKHLFNELKRELDFICDIVFEKDHIHVEFQPKTF